MIQRVFVAAGVAVMLATGAQALAADRGVRITTDKKRYENAQDLAAMTITIFNRSGEAVYLSDLSFEQVELRKKFGWTALENPMRGIRAYIATKVTPGESEQRAVDCFFLPDRKECLGRRAYRIAALVYAGCPGTGADHYPDGCGSVRVVYSNAFTVKREKESVRGR